MHSSVAYNYLYLFDPVHETSFEVSERVVQKTRRYVPYSLINTASCDIACALSEIGSSDTGYQLKSLPKDSPFEGLN